MATIQDLDWNFIWSYFIQAPRIRQWLFTKQPPPSEHVVQALVSSPILTGYIFGPHSELVRSYAFPDIGDLHCVYCSDGDALLGYHFGFQGIHPVLPLMFQVARDPCLGDPSVLVRRTAVQKAPFPGVSCYLSIEFSWFHSGALAVCASVHPIDTDLQQTSGTTPFFDHAELRVFNRSSAELLSKTVNLYASSIDFANFPQPHHFAKLPSDFLEPPDDYHSITIQEPNDSEYDASLILPYVRSSSDQTFAVEREMSVEQSLPPSPNSLGGTPAGTTHGDVTSLADPRTIMLWKEYQDKIANSRRTGLVSSMFSQKKGGRFAKPVSLFGRDSRYSFLSTTGINIHGRIQRLCNQLQLDSSSPFPDTALSTMQQQPGHDRYKECEDIDITNNIYQRVDAASQTVPPPSDDVLRTWAQPPNHAYPSMPMFNPPPMLLASTVDLTGGSTTSSSLSPSASYSEPEHSSGDDMRQSSRKRRRTAMSPFDDTFSKTPILDVHQPPKLVHNAHEHIVTVPSDSARLPLFDTTPNRTFDIADILAQDTRPPQQPSPNGVAVVPVPSSELAISSIQTIQTMAGKDGNRTVPTAKQAADQRAQLIAEPVGSPSVGKGPKTIWICDRCGVQIRGKKGNLHRHIANKHDNIRAYACKVPNCGRKFQTRLNLVRHETAVHKGRPFACPNCPRAFKYEDDLKAHVKSAHTEVEVVLACDVCGSCFGRKSTLNRHKAKVHKLDQSTQKAVSGEA